MDVVEISSPQKVTSQGADMENLFNNQIITSLIGDHFLYS